MGKRLFTNLNLKIVDRQERKKQIETNVNLLFKILFINKVRLFTPCFYQKTIEVRMSLKSSSLCRDIGQTLNFLL
jgi:hypothetical protein